MSENERLKDNLYKVIDEVMDMAMRGVVDKYHPDQVRSEDKDRFKRFKLYREVVRIIRRDAKL